MLHLPKTLRPRLLIALAAAMLCAGPAGVAQNAAGADAGPLKAGNDAGFRLLLLARKNACYIDKADFLELDSAAERLYFVLYNGYYGGPGGGPTAKTTAWVSQANQRQQDIGKNPDAYDLTQTCHDVLNEVKAVHPRATLSVAPTAQAAQSWCGSWDGCWCQVPNFTPPGSTCGLPAGAPPAQSWTPIAGVWKGPQPLIRPSVTVYTDYCYGRKVDGIMFLPHAVPGAQCSVADIHVRQFVETTCPAGDPHCGQSYASSCTGTRNLNAWYLDECGPQPGHYGTTSTDFTVNGVHVIADQPDTWMNGQPVRKTFYDFVMCEDQVLEAFTWTRTGNATSDSRCRVPQSPTYSQPQTVALQPSKELRNVVCGFANSATFPPSDKGIAAIQKLAGGCPGQ